MPEMILPNHSPNHLVGKKPAGKVKENTRMELAACAAQFFAQQGYHGTSTQAIAQQCQIRKASLFHHYKTKEDIALAAIKYVHDECAQHIFKYAEDVNTDTELRITNFLQACEQFFSERVEGLLPTLLGLELSETQVFTQAVENYFQQKERRQKENTHFDFLTTIDTSKEDLPLQIDTTYNLIQTELIEK